MQAQSSGITLLNPNGGEYWQTGKTPDIYWKSQNAGTVILEYSTDAGLSWIGIDTVQCASGKYPWTIPATPSVNCLVRLRAGTLVTTSQDFFQITDDSTECPIVVLGSSTAAGAGVSTPDSAWVNRYRNHIFQNNTRFSVINLGVGGYNTFKILPTGTPVPAGVTIDETRNITKALTYNPYAIIINMPSNDAAGNYGTDTQLANIKLVTDMATAAGAKSFVCTTQPRNFTNAAQIKIQLDTRDAIFAWYGDYVLDFWNGIADSNGFILGQYNSGDGIHLNDAGHLLLVNRVIDKAIATTGCGPLSSAAEQPYIITLGIAQDGGYPHIGCQKNCCKQAWQHDSLRRNVVSLALVSPQERKWWLVEATPDITRQLQLFSELTQGAYAYLPDGILITHAHIGHYTGLMYLGREALGAKQMPVYVLPRMAGFLRSNGPWSQLLQLENIRLHTLQPDSAQALSPKINVTAFSVPHRDEFSETAGFWLRGGGKQYLFIPDIDKWEKFEQPISSLVASADIAFLDATFYSGNELPNRDIREVPHPMVTETMAIFEGFSRGIRQKVCFIHFNHSNPLLLDSLEKQAVEAAGFRVGEEGRRY